MIGGRTRSPYSPMAAAAILAFAEAARAGDRGRGRHQMIRMMKITYTMMFTSQLLEFIQSRSFGIAVTARLWKSRSRAAAQWRSVW